VTPEAVEAFCLSLPGATLAVQWRESRVFKVGGRIFALLGRSGTLSFKCSDMAFHALQALPGIVPAPYLARARWVMLERLDALADEDLLDYLRAAHGLVMARLPRAERERLTGALTPPRPHR
jgi:predicted DNA-binding protein (MmcQ/YjbR family)